MILPFLIPAFYGTVFTEDEEAAFANYRLWESFGFIIAFVIQKLLPIPHKITVLATFLVSGILGYLAIEIHLAIKKRRVVVVRRPS